VKVEVYSRSRRRHHGPALSMELDDTMRHPAWLGAVVVLIVLLAAPWASAAQVETEDFYISSAQDGVKLYLRNKHRDSMGSARPERTVIFVHGASYPSHSSFDVAIEGQSWMDWLAERGYDVYALDLRGYGKSGRPPEMNRPAEGQPPVITTADAVDDLTRAVDFIVSRRSVSRVVLIGWSWGATVAGTYATQLSDRVERLVLYAPQWLRDGPPPSEVDMARLPAWRALDPRQARDAWLKGVPADRRDEVLPSPNFQTWLRATRDSDPQPPAPGQVRAPNGVVLDAMRFWGSGKPAWKPERITMPTLVIQGEWDGEAPPAMGMKLFTQLTNTPMKRYVNMGRATHAALIESNRLHLYRAIQQFLEEPAQ